MYIGVGGRTSMAFWFIQHELGSTILNPLSTEHTHKDNFWPKLFSLLSCLFDVIQFLFLFFEINVNIHNHNHTIIVQVNNYLFLLYFSVILYHHNINQH